MGRRALIGAAALLCGTVVLGAPSPAAAADLVVTTTDDVVDGGDGETSLREAVSAAGDGDVIVLAAGATYQLTLCGEPDTEEDANEDGDLDIVDKSITIRSDSATGLATIENTCPEERVIEIDASFTHSVVLDRLVITGGSISASGGGILNIEGAALLVRDSVITDNHALNGNDGGGLRGRADLVRTTVADNSADAGGGGIMELRGTVVNSTITGNSAEGGGGIHVGEADITASTIVGNGAAFGANFLVTGGGASLHLQGSVVGDPQGGGDNCLFSGGPTVTSGGHNVTSDDSCGLAGTGDAVATGSLGLGALADNGGLTPTMLPSPDSPVAGHVPIDACADGDQRGVARPTGPACEAGAVEIDETAIDEEAPPTTTPAPAPTAPAPATPVPADPSFTG